MINKIKRFICEHPIELIMCCAIILFIILSIILENDMEKHIERVSKECAEQGYGIKATYTKDGDKFYICDKDGDE